MKLSSVLCIAFSLVGIGCAAGKSCPPPPVETERCHVATEGEVAALFERWNAALKSGDPIAVVANYAEESLLLPTMSNKPRLTRAEKVDYFKHFLEKHPTGTIDLRFVKVGCNTALDTGLYTFTFAKTGKKVSGRYSFTYGWDGERWRITSHHSSAMPG